MRTKVAIKKEFLVNVQGVAAQIFILMNPCFLLDTVQSPRFFLAQGLKVL